MFDEILVIIMQRENVIPEPPKNLDDIDKDLFKKHFQNRFEVERSNYGNLTPQEIYKNNRTIYINRDELNTVYLAKEIENYNADFAFIFGVDLILDPVIDKLPKNKVNLHLGLSPWYKGGATLYYPFYNLRPQFCGITFHQITKEADAGEIIHQAVPELNYGDKIHDVGAKCVLKAKADLTKIINHWKIHKEFKGKKQITSGKNWISSDFHASQLRVIYTLFKDDIVDHYLNGSLDTKLPKLFSCIDNK